MKQINKNGVSLAGEFAVLSQLFARGYEANMTLGRTKGVDILVFDPNNEKRYEIEVKTHFTYSPSKPSKSKVFGTTVASWMMSRKHENSTAKPFYCFATISKVGRSFESHFYIVPSKVVAAYIGREHRHWIQQTGNKTSDMRKNLDRIQARAIRRCGELLKKIEAKHTGRPKQIRALGGPNLLTRQSAAHDAGMSDKQRKTAIRAVQSPAPVVARPAPRPTRRAALNANHRRFIVRASAT